MIEDKQKEGLGRCPNCGGLAWKQGRYGNAMDCGICGLELLLNCIDDTARVWNASPIRADLTVIDWDSDAEKLHKNIGDYFVKLADAGLIHNLEDENIFLSGIAAFYNALGRADMTPCYVLKPSMAHDSAFSRDYYDPEHPLMHCPDCTNRPKMFLGVNSVKSSKQSWHCSKCGKEIPTML